MGDGREVRRVTLWALGGWKRPMVQVVQGLLVLVGALGTGGLGA